MRTLRMFKHFCGQDSMKNVVIVTTMWDQVSDEGSQREKQLMEDGGEIFKFLLGRGAAMVRHDGSHESATNYRSSSTESAYYSANHP